MEPDIWVIQGCGLRRNFSKPFHTTRNMSSSVFLRLGKKNILFSLLYCILSNYALKVLSSGRLTIFTGHCIRSHWQKSLGWKYSFANLGGILQLKWFDDCSWLCSDEIVSLCKRTNINKWIEINAYKVLREQILIKHYSSLCNKGLFLVDQKYIYFLTFQNCCSIFLIFNET